MKSYEMNSNSSLVFLEGDRRTKKPSIILFKRKKNKDQLAGIAKITYKEELTATEAIPRYNGKLKSVCVLISIL